VDTWGVEVVDVVVVVEAEGAGAWVVVEAAVAVVGGLVVAWVAAGAVNDEEVTAAAEVVKVAGRAGEVGPLDAQADTNRVAARTAVRRTVETVDLPADRAANRSSAMTRVARNPHTPTTKGSSGMLRRAPTRPNPHQSSIPRGQTGPTGNLDSEEDRYRQ
jgi:hypothetical protein